MAAGWEVTGGAVWDAPGGSASGSWTARPKPGDTLLELGRESATRVRRRGSVRRSPISTDFSEPMAAAARRPSAGGGVSNAESGVAPSDAGAEQHPRPGIFAMATEERTRELLDAAGLRPMRIDHVEMEWEFDTPDDHWHYVMDLAGALAMLIRALPEADQAAVRRRTEENLRPVGERRATTWRDSA